MLACNCVAFPCHFRLEAQRVCMVYGACVFKCVCVYVYFSLLVLITRVQLNDTASETNEL